MLLLNELGSPGASEGAGLSVPPLGLVIVTRNRVDSLLTTLGHLTVLEEPFPILVVDNGSTDGTSDAVRAMFPQVSVITLRRDMGSAARNLGAELLARPYVAFADDDSWWAVGSLSRAVELFDAHPKLGLIMSRILVGPEERLDPTCELMGSSPLPRCEDLPGIPILGFVACGAIVRVSAFLGAGGFNSRFGFSGEEALLAMDLASGGWGLSYVGSVVSHHHPSKQRNVKARLTIGVRDHLWTTWLRRAPRKVILTTLQAMQLARTDRVSRAGLIQALGGVMWALRHRRAIPAELERQLEVLERQWGEP